MDARDWLQLSDLMSARHAHHCAYFALAFADRVREMSDGDFGTLRSTSEAAARLEKGCD